MFNTAQSFDKMIVLTEGEFDYLQQMLDYGSTLRQALLKIRPEYQGQGVNLREKIITVRSRETLLH